MSLELAVGQSGLYQGLFNANKGSLPTQLQDVVIIESTDLNKKVKTLGEFGQLCIHDLKDGRNPDTAVGLLFS